MTGGQAASVYEAWFRKGFDSDPRGASSLYWWDRSRRETACAPGGVGQMKVGISEMETRRLRGYWLQCGAGAEEDTGHPSGPSEGQNNLLQLFGADARRNRSAKIGRHTWKGQSLRHGWRKVMFDAVKDGTVDLTLIFSLTRKNSAPFRLWSRNCPVFRNSTA